MRNVLVLIFLSLIIFNPLIFAQSVDTRTLSYRKENAIWGWYDYGNEEEDGKYLGEIKNLKPDGSGAYTYGKGKWEGDKYEGLWKRGNFNGHGTYTRSDGHKFVGEWKNNVLNDIDRNIVNLYTCVIEKYDELTNYLFWIPKY